MQGIPQLMQAAWSPQTTRLLMFMLMLMFNKTINQQLHGHSSSTRS